MLIGYRMDRLPCGFLDAYLVCLKKTQAVGGSVSPEQDGYAGCEELII